MKWFWKVCSKCNHTPFRRTQHFLLSFKRQTFRSMPIVIGRSLQFLKTKVKTYFVRSLKYSKIYISISCNTDSIPYNVHICCNISEILQIIFLPWFWQNVGNAWWWAIWFKTCAFKNKKENCYVRRNSKYLYNWLNTTEWVPFQTTSPKCLIKFVYIQKTPILCKLLNTTSERMTICFLDELSTVFKSVNLTCYSLHN